MGLLDEVVITEENKDVVNTIMSAGQPHRLPLRMFVYGPKGSGKSTLFQARGREKDLMSEKPMTYAHAEEIMSWLALPEEVAERMLERVGSTTMLLLDGFDCFCARGDYGQQVASLLLEARNDSGLETIVASDIPFDELDRSKLNGVIDKYLRVELKPIDIEGKKQLVRQIAENQTHTKENPPKLSEEAVDVIVELNENDFDGIRNATKFLVTAAGFEDGTVIDGATVREALKL